MYVACQRMSALGGIIVGGESEYSEYSECSECFSALKKTKKKLKLKNNTKQT